MSSKFSELYSDVRSLTKQYAEKVDITEESFMRLFTRGIQMFQRETEYVERVVILEKSGDPLVYHIPEDVLRVVEVRENPGGVDKPILLQEFLQYKRVVDKWDAGETETPNDYVMRLKSYPILHERDIRIGTIYDRKLLVYPRIDDDDYKLAFYYIPDLHAISRSSYLWDSWFVSDTAFMTLFNSASVTPVLQPFEQAFVDYTIGQYMKAAGSPNFQIYESSYRAEVEQAKLMKPTLFREAVASYMLAPYS